MLHRHFQRYRSNRRSGISLLEVLISIGVMSIGLLGVALLIPVAQFKTKQGLLEDRKGLMGRSAVREFRVRAMNNPGTVMFPNWIGYPYMMSDPQGNTQVFTAAGVIRKPYCLDPLMIAAQFGPNAIKTLTPQQVAFFPNGTWANGSTPVGMSRITLDSNVSTGGFQKSIAVLSQQMADEIFRLNDDLVTEVISDRPELPPMQQYLADSNLVPRKRYANGNLTWMATIVPDPGPPLASMRRFNMPTMISNGPQIATPEGNRNDGYILSIVVFNQRVLDPTEEAVGLIDVTSSDGPGEIAVTYDSTPSLQRKYSIGDVRVGDWVMIGRPAPVKANSQVQSAVPFFRWTRVINAEELEELPPGQRVRRLTVSLADTNSISASGSNVATLTYVRGVIAVYEKSIRLDTSSVWNE